MRKTISIIITEPCHQERDHMADVPGGKFCTQCNKTVIDFTTWSDASLYRFFSNPTPGVCGSFLSTQLNTPLVAPQACGYFHRAALALGLSVLLSQYPGAPAFARSPYVHTYTAPSVLADDPIPVDSTILRGAVTNGAGSLGGVEIKLSVGDKIFATAITDSSGRYSIVVENPGTCTLTAAKERRGQTGDIVPEIVRIRKEINIVENRINVEDLVVNLCVTPITTIPYMVSGGEMVPPNVLSGPAIQSPIATFVKPYFVKTRKKHKPKNH